MKSFLLGSRSEIRGRSYSALALALVLACLLSLGSTRMLTLQRRQRWQRARLLLLLLLRRRGILLGR